MAEITEDHVRAALLDCYDMTFPCNIIDLGLITYVLVREDADAPGAGISGVPPRYQVEVGVLSALGEDASEAHLRAQIGNRIGGMEGVSHITVHFARNVAWTPARISQRGRQRLGLDGNPALVQISSR